ncbi:hypothetical protein RRG08_021763 [Elysia crispata]|uniref:Uncharacterized protein n=1 Tax=Elysia crispata TaxID=231223 RepID=A0AAE0ZYK4_9GAST|nr:hypothetical protein RRG08_021763 [Elysia crispata]
MQRVRRTTERTQSMSPRARKSCGHDDAKCRLLGLEVGPLQVPRKLDHRSKISLWEFNHLDSCPENVMPKEYSQKHSAMRLFFTVTLYHYIQCDVHSSKVPSL